MGLRNMFLFNPRLITVRLCEGGVFKVFPVARGKMGSVTLSELIIKTYINLFL